MELAGDLATAFMNTGAARDKNRQLGVASYGELLTWSQLVGLVQPTEAEVLSQAATADPAAALATFERAARARQALVELFVAWQLEQVLPEADLAVFNESLSQGMPAVRLVSAEAGVTWGWVGDPKALDRMLWPVFHAAAELLISTRGRPEVRQCALSGCGLFFVDRTPSGQRRWCEMKTCGNRAKSLRYYRTTGRAARQESHGRISYYIGTRPRPSKQKL